MAAPTQDASDMLAAALEQMDGLIAGARFEMNDKECHSQNTLDVVKAAEELRTAIESNISGTAVNDIPDLTRQYLLSWLRGSKSSLLNGGLANESLSLPSAAELQEKVKRLESDKTSLQLQVQVLSDQVEAQTDKIEELEKNLNERRGKLSSAEELLQHEMVTRSSLETHKLDLMTEISNMKLRLASAEKDKLEIQENLHASQIELKLLQSKLTDRDYEIRGLKNYKRGDSSPDKPSFITSYAAESAAEIERLKMALENMMAANSEKDKVIEELKKTVDRFHKVQEIVSGQAGMFIAGMHDDDSDINQTLKATNEANYFMPSPSAASTPIDGSLVESPKIIGKPPSSILKNPQKGAVVPASTQQPSVTLSNSCEDIIPVVKSSPQQRRYTSETLPARQDQQPRGKHRYGISLGKGILKLKANRSTSAPNLDPNIAANPHAGSYSTLGSDHQRKPAKQKGLKKFFGRIRRTSSQTLEDNERGSAPSSPEEPEKYSFQRGGFRATAGPRLGWSREFKPTELDTPFARWDGDKVAMWMHEIGLTAYVIECKRWVRNGDQLLRATPHDLQKELGIHNHLHRKKLQLALQAVGSEEQDTMCNLDHHWVTRWLDDVGLPQYKEAFSEARVDGRMLHYMTVEDLLQMKVFSSLHHVGFRRGIQLLRLYNYNPNCLRRRPTDDQPVENAPREVMVWTNHRVMEWLRSVDLSEYAPNLRGSGVHGALIILEPKFHAETLAQLLNIPNSKTLLRRHLSTHFSALIGPDVLKQKRDCELQPDFVPLSASYKLKPRGKGLHLFSKKPKHPEVDYDEYVCPMDIQGPSGHIVTRNGGPVQDQALVRVERKKEAQVANEVNSFSKELDTLTTQLEKDVQMLNEATPSSDV